MRSSLSGRNQPAKIICLAYWGAIGIGMLVEGVSWLLSWSGWDVDSLLDKKLDLELRTIVLYYIILY